MTVYIITLRLPLLLVARLSHREISTTYIAAKELVLNLIIYRQPLGDSWVYPLVLLVCYYDVYTLSYCNNIKSRLS